MPIPTSKQLRETIIAEFRTIPGLGGSVPEADRKLHLYFYETDDERESKKYWETTDENREPVINGVMLKRIGRDSEEKVAGKEYIRRVRFRAYFRFGKRGDPAGEEIFEGFHDLIMNKIEGNEAIFQQETGSGGKEHPQPEADQTAQSTSDNLKIWNLRVWEAQIEFDIIVRP